MEAFLVVVVIGVALFLLWSWVQARHAQPSTAAAPEDPSTRFQALGAALSGAGDASSHPRDLASNATFREAVAILVSTDVPIGVVTDYATGANWMPATVACAALCERADREAAGPLIARHFRHLSPWPMYYALKYFTGLTDRPAVGSLVLHGQEYWTLHPLVPALLAEHFSARAALGDTPGFGDSLSDASPEVLTAAEILLRKVNHATARSLIVELTAWRQRTLDREFLQAQLLCRARDRAGRSRQRRGRSDCDAQGRPYRSRQTDRGLPSRLASQVYLIRHGVGDVLDDSPVEVVLAVQPVLDSAQDSSASARWCERILEMHRRWASRRHMQWNELPRQGSSPVLAVVSGFGAARILRPEAGLHLLEYEDAREESARAAARVRIAATPAVLPDIPSERQAALVSELNKAAPPAAVVRRYRLDSAPLIRDVLNGWRTGRQDLVLGGDFDLLADVLGAGH
jgi:hypothetical protein